MLALRPWIALFTVLLVPVVSAYLVLTADGKPQNMAIVAILIILALILLRRTVFEPLRTLRRWRAISNHLNARFFGDLSHEPMVTGTFDGVDFVAGISAHQLVPGRRERYRTLVSSPVFEGVPPGLRVYGSALDEWANDYSERRRVPTGDEVLEGNMRCEGADPEEVRAFVCAPDLRERLLRFLDAWPGMLVHGGESSQLPATIGGASGVVTVSLPGRQVDASVIERCIADVCALAKELNARTQSS